MKIEEIEEELAFFKNKMKSIQLKNKTENEKKLEKYNHLNQSINLSSGLDL